MSAATRRGGRWWLDAALLGAWALSIGAVVFHERGQLWGGVRLQALLHAPLDAQEQWFGLYYQGQRIGSSHLSLLPDDEDGVPGVTVLDRGTMSFSLLGQPQTVSLQARAFIDADWRLRSFAASIQTPQTRLEWSGRRRGESLLVTVATPSSTTTLTIRDPKDQALVSGLSSWAAFRRLKVGQSGSALVLNPLALRPEPVYFTVVRAELLEGRRVLVVETDVAGLTTTSWVTPEGEVLRETSPLGFELRREAREELVRAPPAPALDLLSAASIVPEGAAGELSASTRLMLLVQGLRCGDLPPERPFQRALPASSLADFGQDAPEGAWCLIALTQAQVPMPPAPTTEEPPDRYRRPSPFVQSDDPRLVATARQIVGASDDPWIKAQALAAWVGRTLAKQLTIGLPSALDILARPVGDCHEHTVLFTALARSAGVPTRMIAGLVFQGGRFYYHAWPEVWVGGWVPVDPTLGQSVADVTHLALVEAEHEQLLSLGRFIGALRIRVLSTGGGP
jgi:hypothetical protein